MIRPLNRFVLRYRMLLLLVNVFVLIASFTLLQNTYPHLLVLIELLFNAVLILGVYLVSQNKKIVVVSFLLAVLGITVISFDTLLHSKPLLISGLILETAFFAIATCMVIKHVLQYKKITEDKIYGAITAYFLIGIIWAMIFSILELSQVSSFFFGHGFLLQQAQLPPHRFYFSQFLYLSFVTLSTLGYGDIVPISGSARLFSSLEAIIGQLYVAVLIARLVGIHISHDYKTNKSP